MLKQVHQSLRRSRYGAAQFARIGWYTTQYINARHIAGPVTPPGYVPRPYNAPGADRSAVRTAFFDLIAAEAKDIAEGVYNIPRDLRTMPNIGRVFRRARTFSDEAKSVARRALSKGGATEVRARADASSLPTYYAQNFHFQSEGWLGESSADIYDTQVEALFTGAADAMRRRALPFIRQEVERVGADLTLADVGCGTGRLLRDVLDNFSRINATGIDLSPAYLRKAEEAISPYQAHFVQAAAESLPLPDNSMDVLFTVYLFHELPAAVRAKAVAEFARVLKPGGLYIHVDTVQYGDTAMDVMLEGFPRAVHEPYYDNYCKQDLGALFAEQQLAKEAETVGFLTKVTTARKPSAE